MLGKIAVLLLATMSLVACGDPSGEELEDSVLGSQEQEASVQAGLAELRQLTARYHDVDVAGDDDFHLGINGILTNCVQHPVDPATFGAMGYHFGNQERFDDVTIDEMAPEVLVYQKRNNGTYKLGAVEWVVPKVKWEEEHGVGADPPVVHGHPLKVLNPALGWYVGHAWIWKPNPAGIMSDWNPNVTCP